MATKRNTTPKTPKKTPQPARSLPPVEEEDDGSDGTADPNEALLAKLKPKQRLFCEYYMADANQNGARAARMAGYLEPKNAAYRLLNQNAHVRAYIDTVMEEYGMGTKEVLYRLAQQARGDLSPFLYADAGDDLVGPPKTAIEKAAQKSDWEDDEETGHDPTAFPHDDTPETNVPIYLHTRAARANIGRVKKITVTSQKIERMGEDEDEGPEVITTTSKVSLELKDSDFALDRLARIHGMYKENANPLMGLIDITKLSNAQVDALAAGADLLAVILMGQNGTEPAQSNEGEEA